MRDARESDASDSVPDEPTGLPGLPPPPSFFGSGIGLHFLEGESSKVSDSSSASCRGGVRVRLALSLLSSAPQLFDLPK